MSDDVDEVFDKPKVPTAVHLAFDVEIDVFLGVFVPRARVEGAHDEVAVFEGSRDLAVVPTIFIDRHDLAALPTTFRVGVAPSVNSAMTDWWSTTVLSDATRSGRVDYQS
ncbi:hypothetical protein G1H11_21460 [Phytoactinopolyspora alkaliphila]|uniref:Uncharacterized protein n=1 Tax=Phytoactinopolyspora alkaliphila TaxID=1783498 RepID=A0A6N9YSE3_9ACTN|nr:hypothetical protein [Phytoactinopolyspora alkaliphila]NED97870.1 hypothetical protein [Phytoactinopolyspora alkaliphila]